ncbi:hypothetical protein DC082_02680 [Ignatzschineria indica]|uniref:Uncharacterized protein n=1 Tax=Ignatzschineria indica TaxID=472583 RepID=A0A2U2AMU6_9GAMM|nr:hypothetical protein DC082_02680 [Ignatzschineria indica]
MHFLTFLFTFANNVNCTNRNIIGSILRDQLYAKSAISVSFYSSLLSRIGRNITRYRIDRADRVHNI